jgi:hypothetical protein
MRFSHCTLEALPVDLDFCWRRLLHVGGFWFHSEKPIRRALASSGGSDLSRWAVERQGKPCDVAHFLDTRRLPHANI